MSDGYNRRGLRAAAQSLARTMRRIAAVRTTQTADAVNVKETASVFFVRAGTPTGRWRWTPIQAYMISRNARHPGPHNDREHWYNENLHHGNAPYPIDSMTADQGATEAAEAYTREAIDPLLESHGFK
jgi:hypothetical protein